MYHDLIETVPVPWSALSEVFIDGNAVTGKKGGRDAGLVGGVEQTAAPCGLHGGHLLAHAGYYLDPST